MKIILCLLTFKQFALFSLVHNDLREKSPCSNLLILPLLIYFILVHEVFYHFKFQSWEGAGRHSSSWALIPTGWSWRQQPLFSFILFLLYDFSGFIRAVTEHWPPSNPYKVKNVSPCPKEVGGGEQMTLTKAITDNTGLKIFMCE